MDNSPDGQDLDHFASPMAMLDALDGRSLIDGPHSDQTDDASSEVPLDDHLSVLSDECLGEYEYVGYLPHIICAMEPRGAAQCERRDRVDRCMKAIELLLNRASSGVKRRAHERVHFKVHLLEVPGFAGMGRPTIQLIKDDDPGVELPLFPVEHACTHVSGQIRSAIEAIAECVAIASEWQACSPSHKSLWRPISLVTQRQQAQVGCAPVEVPNQIVAVCALTIFEDALSFSGLEIEFMGERFSVPDLESLKQYEQVPASDCAEHTVNVGDVQVDGIKETFTQQKDTRNAAVATTVEILREALMSGIPAKVNVALRESPSRKPEKSISVHDLAGLRVRAMFRNYYPQVTRPSRIPKRSLIETIVDVESSRGRAPKEQQIVP
jgi:hypothetical protein